MKFGRLAHIDNVDFNLPSAFSYVENKHNNNCQVNIGATGWAMNSWKGHWYPSDANANQFFGYYSQQFNAIEFNSSYYAVPGKDKILSWQNQAPADFTFYPKLPQSISRSKQPINQWEHWIRFRTAFELLGPQFGGAFLQLSENQGLKYTKELFQFLDKINGFNKLHIEFRAEDIFNDESIFHRLAKSLNERQIGLVITDVAGRRDVLHMVNTTDHVLVRFVGNNDESTDLKRIDLWIDQIDQWREKGVKNLAFFVHQPDNMKAPWLAQYLAENLQAISGLSVRGPKQLEEQKLLF